MRSNPFSASGRRLAGTVCALAACALWAVVGEAQKGGGKPKPSPAGVSADFASDVDLSAPLSACVSLPPGISGDGSIYGFDASTQTGAYLRAGSDNDFVLKLLGAGPPFVYLNFSTQLSGSVTSTLPPGFCDVVLSEFNFDTHVLGPNGENDIGLGLYDIPAGETRPSRIRAFFSYSDKDGNPRTYTIRFNPVDYPGSKNVAITRGPADDPSGLPGNGSIVANQWVIQTGPYAVGSGDTAQLVSPALTRKTHPGPNDEGFYALPFKITVTLP